LEESVGLAAALRAEGKVRHVGLSNVDVVQLERARRIVASVQNGYSVADREHEPVVGGCERDRLAFLAYSRLENGGGFRRA